MHGITTKRLSVRKRWPNYSGDRYFVVLWLVECLKSFQAALHLVKGAVPGFALRAGGL